MYSNTEINGRHLATKPVVAITGNHSINVTHEQDLISPDSFDVDSF